MEVIEELARRKEKGQRGELSERDGRAWITRRRGRARERESSESRFLKDFSNSQFDLGPGHRAETDGEEAREGQKEGCGGKDGSLPGVK